MPTEAEEEEAEEEEAVRACVGPGDRDWRKCESAFALPCVVPF